MSLLDTASLIVTPNGYKEGKLYSVIPSDGSGDMSVTRATTATRVNSSGLVELVPYNLLSYSEQIDNGYWSKYQSTITANATTAPDGTLTADRLNQTGPFSGNFFVTPSAFNGGLVSLSCFYKKGIGNVGWLEINRGAESCYIQFNLDTQVISASGYYVSTNIESVGNGWYRCSVVSNQSAGTANYVGFGNIGNNGDTIFAWGAQLNEGTLKDYQKTETRLNIPRLDYSNGTCPSILVEPQRTNLALWSSSFTNVMWNTVSVTSNTTTAPDGTLTADTYNASQSNELWQPITASTSTTYTMSLYVKLGTATNLCLVVNNGAAWNTIGGQSFDSSDGLNTSTWTRIKFTFTTPSTLPIGVINFHIGGNAETGLTQSTGTAYIWGAQLELGSYQTSYIPTTSASVTRNADTIFKTGATSLIGQTEGTLFVDLYFNHSNTTTNIDTRIWSVWNSVNNALISIWARDNDLRYQVFDSSVGLNIENSITASDARHKIALAYNGTNLAVYMDGNQITNTTMSAAAPSTSILGISSFWNNVAIIHQLEINSAALWKTRLTNAQLATLTTI